MNTLPTPKEQQKMATAAVADFEFLCSHTKLSDCIPRYDDLAGIRAMHKDLPADMFEQSDFCTSYYILEGLRQELGGKWAVEKRQRMAMYGQPYITGYCNLDYEYPYRKWFELRDDDAIKYVENHFEANRKAKSKQDRFLAEFGDRAGSELGELDVARRCAELSIIPNPDFYKMRYKVERKRVKMLAKKLKIKLI